MLENQNELRSSHGRHFSRFKDMQPRVGELYDELSDEVYREGALSTKHKRLMALVGALVHGCDACILFQCDKSLAAGAGLEEISEACSVAISLGGTMAAGQTCRLMRFLEDRGDI